MHPIVALWSHPRSMSTAFERVMRERGDFRCFHEPFLYLYYVGDAKRALPHFEADPAQPTGYEAIRDMLLDAAREGPVFFKDMSYYALDHLLRDAAFAHRVTNTFLVRDPAASIVSYHRLDPDLTREEVGVEDECLHHRWLRALTGAVPPVVDAADLARDPEAVMRRYAAAIGVEFLPRALEWKRPPPAEWRAVAGWHGSVSTGTGIRAGGERARACRPDPARVLEAHPRLQSLYRHHLPFYRELSAQRLRID